MKSIIIKKIRFGSYVKLNQVISIAIGVVFGVLFLIIGLFGGPVTANFGNAQFTGITAGILGLFICPVVLSLFGFMISLITYLPFTGAIKILKRIELLGDFACECESDFLVVENKNDTNIESVRIQIIDGYGADDALYKTLIPGNVLFDYTLEVKNV